MRKAGIWVLILTLLISLTACGAGETPETPETTAVPTVTEATVPPTQAPTETTEPEKKITFQEMTAYEDERCKVQITGLTGFDKETEDHCIHINFENKLEEQSLLLYLDFLSVNGVQFDIFNGFATLKVRADEEANNDGGNFLIPAKESANATIHIRGEEEYRQICSRVGEISDIGLRFYYFNEDNYDLLKGYSPLVHIYPYGEENAVKATREELPTDKVIFDNEYARVIVTGFVFEVRKQRYALNLFIENKTENGVEIETHHGETVINDEPISDYYSNLVDPEMCAYSKIIWRTSDFEELGIDQVETIDLTLQMMSFDMKELEKGNLVTPVWSEDVEVTLNP